MMYIFDKENCDTSLLSMYRSWARSENYHLGQLVEGEKRKNKYGEAFYIKLPTGRWAHVHPEVYKPALINKNLEDYL